MIYKSIINAYVEKMQRKWEKLYFAIDLHGTIIQKYRGNDIFPYPHVKDVLIELSKMPDIVLILYTSTYVYNLKPFLSWCRENGVVFVYINENPDCSNNSTGDFSKKFYFNVLIDDRAGFDPEEWIDVLRAVKIGSKMQNCKMIDCNHSLIKDCNSLVCSICDDQKYYTQKLTDIYGTTFM